VTNRTARAAGEHVDDDGVKELCPADAALFERTTAYRTVPSAGSVKVRISDRRRGRATARSRRGSARGWDQLARLCT
jgi:hypothetical protein